MRTDGSSLSAEKTLNARSHVRAPARARLDRSRPTPKSGAIRADHPGFPDVRPPGGKIAFAAALLIPAHTFLADVARVQNY
jgi:hypothetical protein